MPGPTLELIREIRLDGGLRIRDTKRDRGARSDVRRRLSPPGRAVCERVAVRSATVSLGDLRITVRSWVPRLWQWIDPDYGVLAIEPASCSALGRAHDLAQGRFPVVEPGEKRVTALEIDVEAA